MHKLNAVKKYGKMYIRRSNYIGTQTFGYTVWIAGEGKGTTITCESWTDNQWCYRLPTKNLPADIDSLPYGPERVEKVHAWYKRLERLSYKIIRKAFPETRRATWWGCGDVTICEDQII